MRRLGMIWLLGSALPLVVATPALTAPPAADRVEVLVVDASHGPAEVGPVRLIAGRRYVLDVSGQATQTTPSLFGGPAATFEDDALFCFQSGGSGHGCTPPFYLPGTLLQIGIGTPTDLINAFPSQSEGFSNKHRYTVNFVPPRTGKLAAANPFTIGDQTGNPSTYSGVFTIIVKAPPSHCRLSFRFTTNAKPVSENYIVRSHGAGTITFNPSRKGTCTGGLGGGVATKKTTLVRMQVSPSRRLTLHPEGALFLGNRRAVGDEVEVFTSVSASNDPTCPVGSRVYVYLYDNNAQKLPNAVRFTGSDAHKGMPACKLPREELASLDKHHVSVSISTPVDLRT
jgi:hypothetical protein